jgi:hypothetical protein
MFCFIFAELNQNHDFQIKKILTRLFKHTSFKFNYYEQFKKQSTVNWKFRNES